MLQKEDRRVRITKQAIRDSLLELMQEYPIAKISVKMICERADINRSTFYAHYADQNDLLNRLQTGAVQGIKSHVFTANFVQQAQAATPVIVKVLEYCRANRALFTVILSENGDTTFQRELMQMVQEKTIAELREDKRLKPRATKYMELFAIAGILSMIRVWLAEGCVDSPEELAGLMTRFLYEGLCGLFRGEGQ